MRSSGDPLVSERAQTSHVILPTCRSTIYVLVSTSKITIIRLHIMTHYQFMVQFCDFPIKHIKIYFLWLYLLLFDAFMNHWFMAQEFWHNFLMRGQKHYSDNEIDQAIDEYCSRKKLNIVYDHLTHIPRRKITGRE